MWPARSTVAALLIALTWAAFWPALSCGFVNYDDPTYVVDNPHVRNGLNTQDIVWTWTHSQSHFWLPITSLSLQADAQLFHNQAWGFHLTNLVLHTFNVLLLFLILQAMTASVWRSAVAAAIFAVHPLRAESVVWITERKDVLSTALGLLALAAYVRYARTPRGLPYALTLLLFALSLLAKPMLVTLPLLLLLLDYWPLRRVEGLKPVSDVPTHAPCPIAARPLGMVLMEKVPMLVLAAASGVITMRTASGAAVSLDNLSIPARLSNALVSYGRYLGKTVWPAGLEAYYPMPPSWAWWQVAGCTLLIVAATALALRSSWRQPWLPVGWLWFLVSLLPVIGIAQNGTQAMADRFTYVPAIGLSILLAFSIPESWARTALRRTALITSGTVAAAALVGLTNVQSRTWHDSKTLFLHALSVDPHNYVAHRNLGAALESDGDLDGAIAQYRLAIKDRPAYALLYNNLAAALARRGRRGDLDDAIEQLRAAIHLDDKYAEAAFNLSHLLAQSHNSRGVALAQSSRLLEAQGEFRLALKEWPDMRDARENLENVERLLNNPPTQPATRPE